MFPIKKLFAMMLYTGQIYEVAMRLIYVTMAGKDLRSCGTLFLPCRTIEYAVSKARHLQDEVLVNGSHYGRKAVFTTRSTIFLERSITIKGVNGQPTIASTYGSTLFVTKPSADRNLTFSIENFNFINKKILGRKPNSFIFLQDSSLSLKNCIFRDIPRPIHSQCNTECKIEVANCKVLSPKVGLHLLGAGKYQANIKESHFVGTPNKPMWAIVIGSQSAGSEENVSVGAETNISVSSCRFGQFSTAIISYTRSILTAISIKYSYFWNNYISNVGGESFGSAISLEDEIFSPLHELVNSQITLLVSNCVFRNNTAIEGGGISLRLQNSSFNGSISKCIFTDNSALAAGGAISLFSYPPNTYSLSIEHCSFSGNSASYGNYSNFGYDYAPTTTFGSGGAVFVGEKCQSLLSKTVINFCHFRNNFAQRVGGTIFGQASISLINLEIESAALTTFRPSSGEVISSTGKSILENVTIHATKPSFGHSVVELSAHTRSLKIDKNCKFTCPKGTIAVIVTSDLKSDTFSGNMMQFFSFQCKRCAPGLYTLGRSMFYKQAINGRKCKKCPTGGTCVTGQLKPEESFWGFTKRENDSVRFIQLPTGYGCTRELCKRYDSCAANRQSQLCGLCREGFTESILSTTCIKHEQCRIKHFWMLAVALLLSYLVFFLYKKEIISFLKRQLLWFKKVRSVEDNQRDAIHCEEPGSPDSDEESVNRDRNISHRDDNNGTAPSRHSELDSDFTAGCLKIIFYFYQIDALLKPYDGEIKKSIALDIKHAIKNFFNFNFLPHFGSSSCAMPNVTPTFKVFIRIGLVASTPLVLILLYFIAKVVRFVFANVFRGKQAFGNRVLIALFEVLLFSYSVVTAMTFTMLTCHEFGKINVLYIQGDVTCYQSWQYAFVVIGILWVLPFCAFVFILPGLLSPVALVTTRYMYLGCFFPLPFMVYFFIKLRSKCQPCNQDDDDVFTDTRSSIHLSNQDQSKNNIVLKTVYQERCGAFKDHVNSNRYFSWEGFYIFRRLVLVSVFTFVKSPMYKLYLSLLAQIIFLLHHVHVKPYKEWILNVVEATSLTLLVVFNCMDLFAVYDSTHGGREGQYLLLLKIFAWIETVGVLFPPAIISVCLLCLVVARAGYFIGSLAKKLPNYKCRLQTIN